MVAPRAALQRGEDLGWHVADVDGRHERDASTSRMLAPVQAAPPKRPRARGYNGRVVLPDFAKLARLCGMGTMNVSLPQSLKVFVEEQAAERGYGTTSEYVRELIRNDRDRQHLRSLLLEGAASPPSEPADPSYFDALREGVRERARR